jgi:glutamyl-tRNA reductase
MFIIAPTLRILLCHRIVKKGKAALIHSPHWVAGDIFARSNYRCSTTMGENGIRLVVAGVNFHKTSLAVRNKFALTTEHIKSIYSDKESGKEPHFFVLSTCNRTEIYSTAAQPQQLLKMLAQHNQIAADDLDQYAFIKQGDEAMKHLFRVASGLDSQILGDYEIIGQLKNAFVMAKEYNRTNGYMEKAVNGALQASRQVKKSTTLSDGTTSVSYATIQLLKETAGDRHLNVCLLGLGKIGTLTLKNLRNYLPQYNVTVVNRNESKAQTAANEYQVDYAPYNNQQEVLAHADVLIVATGADHAVISKEDIAQSNVKLIFDLSVPSNVSADVREISGVKFYNIDELSQIVNKTIALRMGELPLAEQIIEEHYNEFRQWEERRSIYKNQAETQLTDNQRANDTNSNKGQQTSIVASPRSED